jgi:Type VI secretion system effector, Hcp
MTSIRRRWVISLGIVALAAIAPLAVSAATQQQAPAHAQSSPVHTAAIVPTAGPTSVCVGTQAYFAIPTSVGAPIDLTNATPLLSVDGFQANTTTIGSAGGGAGAGKATFSPLILSMRPNPGTEALFTTLATGAHYDEVAVLFVGKSGGVQTVCRTIRMRLVFITKLEEEFGVNTSGPSGPVDVVTLVFGALTATDGGSTATWSVVTNSAS